MLCMNQVFTPSLVSFSKVKIAGALPIFTNTPKLLALKLECFLLVFLPMGPALEILIRRSCAARGSGERASPTRRLQPPDAAAT